MKGRETGRKEEMVEGNEIGEKSGLEGNSNREDRNNMEKKGAIEESEETNTGIV